MKNILFIWMLLFCVATGKAQFGPQQLISTAVSAPRAVFAADIDGDGDMDVLASSEGDEKVAWYENMDGLGDFGVRRIIGSNVEGARKIFAADLDGDSDIDVLATAGSGDQVIWFKNLDGFGTFGSQQIVTDQTDGPLSVFAIDLDGDGDLDVLSASFNDNKIAWYQNDGVGNFGIQQIITNSALSARDVYAEDLDGDGDMDVLAAAAASDEVLWFENTDGLGNFGPTQVITNNTNGVLSVFASDLDGDGDMDVLSASPSDNKLAWFENINGLSTFEPGQIIASNLTSHQVVYATDLDNDGDMDVLAVSVTTNPDGAIAWYENIDGLGVFGPPQIITTDLVGPRGVYTSDLDNDGDLDVLSVSQGDNKIAWYENYTILGINENANLRISVTPNPVSGVLQLRVPSQIQIKNIKLFNVLGKAVLQTQENTQQLDMSQLSSGLYFLELRTNKGVVVKKIIKE